MIKKVKTLCDIIGGAFALLCIAGILDKWIALAVAFGFLGISNSLVAKQYFDQDKRQMAYTSLIIGIVMYVMLAVALVIAM